MNSRWGAYLDLRLDRISILPVVSNRLGFAVFVRRALAALESENEGAFTREDVIAVALPRSMENTLRSAIAKLPEILLVVSCAHPQVAREVFGVTPGDGIVEAIRWAIENHVPLRFIDREVAPGNLLERDCSPDPAWADDGYVLERGAAAYLDLVSKSLLRAPRRQEPVDTWREVFMTLELRRLCVRFRRVVFVCQAPHARPVRALLSGEMGWRGLEEEPEPAVEFEILKPNPQVLLRYLDDIPRLVERYEKVRREGDGLALGFDKRTALLAELRDFSGGLAGEKPSPRHLRAFCKLLPAQLRSAGRLTPRLEDLVALANCCFDRRFQREFYHHLIGYSGQVDVHRVGPLSSNHVHEEPPDGSAAQGDPGGVFYVSRGCNPAQQIFTILPKNPSAIEDPFVWPPWSEHHNAMRRKVYRVARSLQKIQLTCEYRGSIEQGIDLRRTLASYYRGDPQIFVHRTLRRRHESQQSLPEPILWIFAAPGIQPAVQDRWVQFRWDDSHGAFLLIYTERRNVYAEAKDNGGRIVDLCDAVGAVSFYDLSTTLDSARKALGDGLEKHLPPGVLLSSFSAKPSTWLDDLVEVALPFAEKRLFCVSPAGLAVPLPQAIGGKELVRIPAERLGLRSFEKLSSYCIVDGGRKKAHQTSDEVSREIIARYAEVMDTRWP